MNGQFKQFVERNRTVVWAALGSTVVVSDAEPKSASKVEARGPARVDVEEWEFTASSKETEVDLERTRSGTTPDVSYDHVTGELRLLNGTQVSRVRKNNARSGLYPSENDCLKSEDWTSQLPGPDVLSANVGTFMCVKTSEGDLGFMQIDAIQPGFFETVRTPPAYSMHSYVWVR